MFLDSLPFICHRDGVSVLVTNVIAMIVGIRTRLLKGARAGVIEFDQDFTPILSRLTAIALGS